MHTYVYPARITRAPEGGWNIRFRDLPDAISQAEAGEDAVEIPEPSAARPGEVLVAVPVETATKAALLTTVAESGMSRVAIAKAVGLDEKEIRRMLDPRHASKIPRVAKVLRALGKEMQLTVVDATRVQAAPRASAQRDALKVMQKRKRFRVQST